VDVGEVWGRHAGPRWALLAEVDYRAKSAAGKIRHPFFKGIREDQL